MIWQSLKKKICKTLGFRTKLKFWKFKVALNPMYGIFLTCKKLHLKAGTHEGACSHSTLLQHAPGAKLPRLHQRFLAKKYVAQQNFCSRVLLPHIKLVWYEGESSRGKSVARFCFRSKLPRVYWNLLCGSMFQEQTPSCVLVELGYLPGSVFQE